jgi:hypothetical protein
MAVPIDSSSEAVAATADKIFDSMGKIKILCDELSDACGRLGKTFQDEGYGVIKNYVAKTGNMIEDTFPSLQKIAKNLYEYADILERSVKEINN